MHNTTCISFDTLMAEMRRPLYLAFFSSSSFLRFRPCAPDGIDRFIFANSHVADMLTAHPTLAMCRSPHITNVTSLNATPPPHPHNHTTTLSHNTHLYT